MVFLKPTYLIDGDVTDIHLDQLRSDGIRGLIFDLDSTLIAPRSGQLTPDVSSWLRQARAYFKVAIVSNNKKPHYIKHIQQILDMPTIGFARKPSRRAFKEALEILGLQPQEVAVVGDRPLTDVLGGQRAGLKTILVYPLKSMNEPCWITFLRKLERSIIKI